MGTRRVLAYASIVTMTAAVALAPVGSAWADPPGCTAATTSFTNTKSGYMTAVGTGRCTTSRARALRVEIKQDLFGRPDALVAANTDSGSKRKYDRSVSSCDNGDTNWYYGRTFFTSGDDYKDSNHRLIDSCE